MILLDTNVISELWKMQPNKGVLTWIDAQSVETLFLSVVTVAELSYGIATMAKGKRRAIYQERFEKEVLPMFQGRVLAFDLAASQAYANLMAQARVKGKTIAMADGYIAATAATHNLIVATRDVTPFEVAGLNVINPWDVQ